MDDRRLGSQLDGLEVTAMRVQHEIFTGDGKTQHLNCVVTASNGDEEITWVVPTEDAPNFGDPVIVNVGWTSRERDD